MNINKGEKVELHKRNKHRGQYDYNKLAVTCPLLSKYIKPNKYNNLSIDFFNPEAVKMLNSALLQHFYGMSFWNIPDNYLTPPIPGRADYIHYIADLLSDSNNKTIPKGKKVTCLDVGVGANCIYPIIGNSEYDWSFIGSDIDGIALKSAKNIVNKNPELTSKVELRLQQNANDIFKGVIKKHETIDVTICNPPFHSSLAQANAGTIRKLSNLKKKSVTNPTLNFKGKSNELWCQGGERIFIKRMIIESKLYAKNVLWFTTLVSKDAHLKTIYNILKSVAAADVKTIPMAQGNKISRIVAWTYFNNEERVNWFKNK